MRFLTGLFSVRFQTMLLCHLALNRDDVNVRTIFSLSCEFHDAVCKCEQSVIFAHAYIVTRIVLCAALTNDDVACDYCLSTENFHSESFAV